MFIRYHAAASVFTREVFLTLAFNFFPVEFIGVSATDPKDITSVVGQGWGKWLEYSADGIHRMASKSISAGMLKNFALFLLETTQAIMPGARSILEQLEPVRALLCGLYTPESKKGMKLSELKSAFKSATEGYGPASKCSPDFELWTVLPQLLSFAASASCSRLSQALVDDCRQLLSASQHALCRIFFKFGSSKDSVLPPQQLLFKDCPKGLLCSIKLDTKKSKDKLHWPEVTCVNCNRPAEEHALRFSPEDLQLAGDEQEQFVRALSRIGSIGWHPHKFMGFLHTARGRNLAAFSDEACEESLQAYMGHTSRNCLSLDPVADSCECCRPYSLEECCRALPLHARVISEEADALKASRRAELQRVMGILSGSKPPTSASVGAAKVSDPAANSGGRAMQQPFTSATLAAQNSKPERSPHLHETLGADDLEVEHVLPPAPPAAATAGAAKPAPSPPAHVLGPPATATLSHVSLQPSASALQPEVSQLSTLQELLEQLPVADKSPEDQKQWIKQNAAELGKFSKQQRTLLNDFARDVARGPPAAKEKKGKDKKEAASEPVSRQPPVPSEPVHESPSSASTAAAQPAPHATLDAAAPPSDSRAPAVVESTARTFAS